MKIRIVNEDGVGFHTKILTEDGVDISSSVKSVDLHAEVHGLVEARVVYRVVPMNIVATVKERDNMENVYIGTYHEDSNSDATVYTVTRKQFEDARKEGETDEIVKDTLLSLARQCKRKGFWTSNEIQR